jgi:SsrA-binding protein
LFETIEIKPAPFTIFAGMKTAFQNQINIRNKRASFDYEFIEKFVAGIVLLGTEIKSIRLGKVSMNDAYCHFVHGEMLIKNLSISAYDFGTCNNHEVLRERVLLLNRKELNKMERKVKENGLTIIPIRLFLNDKGLVKVEIALAKGKHTYDKRQSLKDKDSRREMDRHDKY